MNILIFTGAGISAESGIKTFRDNNGLWENEDPMEVASIRGWQKNPQKVIDFYNNRRLEIEGVMPNLGHLEIAAAEKNHSITIVTQNVDDLHEKAGSTKIIHLHGELNYLKTESPSRKRIPFDHDLKLGELDSDGYQYRPDVVWFGEGLSQGDVMKAKQAAWCADVCIIVGTSMQVFPAAEIPWETPDECVIYYVDPGELDFSIPEHRKSFFYHIQEKASTGVKKAFDKITK